MWIFGRSVYIMEYYAPFRVARQLGQIADIVGDIPVHPQITREVRYWGPTMSPLDAQTSFQITFHIVWDERMGAGEDPGMTGGYRSWWEGHLSVWLTILGVLDDEELEPGVDQVVGGEDDVPGERVMVYVGRGVGRQQRRVWVV